MKAFLQPPMKGVVLETYGTGNAPDNRPDLLDALKDAVDQGIIIINCTQCLKGTVSASYATGTVDHLTCLPVHNFASNCLFNAVQFKEKHLFTCLHAVVFFLFYFRLWLKWACYLELTWLQRPHWPNCPTYWPRKILILLQWKGSVPLFILEIISSRLSF